MGNSWNNAYLHGVPLRVRDAPRARSKCLRATSTVRNGSGTRLCAGANTLLNVLARRALVEPLGSLDPEPGRHRLRSNEHERESSYHGTPKENRRSTTRSMDHIRPPFTRESAKGCCRCSPKYPNRHGCIENERASRTPFLCGLTSGLTDSCSATARAVGMSPAAILGAFVIAESSELWMSEPAVGEDAVVGNDHYSSHRKVFGQP